MRLADFIIIGAAKSGTTTLHHYLDRHPQVFMSTPKEPTFFARDERYRRGVEWYASLFEPAARDQICGEASTNYSNWPLYARTVERMAELLPDVKLIYIMRHPVDRAYSHYVQVIKGAREEDPNLKVQETFEEHIERDPSAIASSDYMMQIERYLPVYPRERFLFLRMDDLVREPAATMAAVCRFLGIDDSLDLTSEGPIVANRTSEHTDWLIRSKVTEPLRAIPGVPQLAALVPQGARDQVYRVLSLLPHRKRLEREYLTQPMLPETRARLLERFREPNRRLAEFLGWDLSAWER